MRVIKFRVWDSRFSKFLKLDGSILMHPESGLLHGSRSSGNVDYWLLQQFTGLLDKNGVEIYEGDIIECWGVNLKIVWDESDASFFADSPNSNIYESGQEWGSNCVVIGNIHEAPELLK